MVKKFLFGGAGSDRSGDVGLLILRVIMGLYLCINHGLVKLQGMDKVYGMMVNLHVPVPDVMAWVVALTEFLGGILIVLGLLTRPACVAALILFLVAFFHAHAGTPLGTRELAAVYFGMTCVILGQGAGRFSLDRLIQKK